MNHMSLLGRFPGIFIKQLMLWIVMFTKYPRACSLTFIPSHSLGVCKWKLVYPCNSWSYSPSEYIHSSLTYESELTVSLRHCSITFPYILLKSDNFHWTHLRTIHKVITKWVKSYKKIRIVSLGTGTLYIHTNQAITLPVTQCKCTHTTVATWGM